MKMKQLTIFDLEKSLFTPSYDISKYIVTKISSQSAKEYIIKNHYSHGCHHSPSACYGLFDNGFLIGVLIFATPCSENVRASLFGKDYKDNVIELHRLHILDVTPRNTESWFISKCVKRLIIDRPQTWGIISFSDTTIGHEGTIYKATNFIRCGKTGNATFYLDTNGRLHHPRQCGINISLEEANKRGWKPVKRDSKNRYIMIIGLNKKEKKEHLKLFYKHNPQYIERKF